MMYGTHRTFWSWACFILTLVLFALPGFVARDYPQAVPYIFGLALLSAFFGVILLREDIKDNETDRHVREAMNDIALKRDQIKLDLAREIKGMRADQIRELGRNRISLIKSGPKEEYEFIDEWHRKTRVPKQFVIDYLTLASDKYLTITGNKGDEGFSDDVHWQDDPNEPTLRQLAEDVKHGLEAQKLVSKATNQRYEVADWQEICDYLGLELSEIEKGS